tara:strand:- start:374 stop:547 length:174 start_codon:yes stop_codon:yes gene_type:complete
MSKEDKKPKLIIPSKEDIERNEQMRKDIEWIKEKIIKASMIPRKYFDSKDKTDNTNE